MTFNEEMDMILIDIYSKKKSVMERNDRTIQANLARNTAWSEIVDAVNAIATMKKTRDQLVSRYKYLNMKAKNKNLSSKKHVKGTGGGTPLKIDNVSQVLIDSNVADPTYNGLPGAVSSAIVGVSSQETDNDQFVEEQEEVKGE